MAAVGTTKRFVSRARNVETKASLHCACSHQQRRERQSGFKPCSSSGWLRRLNRHIRIYGVKGLSVLIFFGKSAVDQPPPNASISATLATSRLCCTDRAVCWSESNSVCSVITLV
jgi:hypothetical protein